MQIRNYVWRKEEIDIFFCPNHREKCQIYSLWQTIRKKNGFAGHFVPSSLLKWGLAGQHFTRITIMTVLDSTPKSSCYRWTLIKPFTCQTNKPRNNLKPVVAPLTFPSHSKRWSLELWTRRRSPPSCGKSSRAWSICTRRRRSTETSKVGRSDVRGGFRRWCGWYFCADPSS